MTKFIFLSRGKKCQRFPLKQESHWRDLNPSGVRVLCSVVLTLAGALTFLKKKWIWLFLSGGKKICIFNFNFRKTCSYGSYTACRSHSGATQWSGTVPQLHVVYWDPSEKKKKEKCEKKVKEGKIRVDRISVIFSSRLFDDKNSAIAISEWLCRNF